jgi:hypothetical protein
VAQFTVLYVSLDCTAWTLCFEWYCGTVYEMELSRAGTPPPCPPPPANFTPPARPGECRFNVSSGQCKFYPNTTGKLNLLVLRTCLPVFNATYLVFSSYHWNINSHWPWHACMTQDASFMTPQSVCLGLAGVALAGRVGQWKSMKSLEWYPLHLVLFHPALQSNQEHASSMSPTDSARSSPTKVSSYIIIYATSHLSLQPRTYTLLHYDMDIMSIPVPPRGRSTQKFSDTRFPMIICVHGFYTLISTFQS